MNPRDWRASAGYLVRLSDAGGSSGGNLV